jgi:hypothetical protein
MSLATELLQFLYSQWWIAEHSGWSPKHYTGKHMAATMLETWQEIHTIHIKAKTIGNIHNIKDMHI